MSRQQKLDPVHTGCGKKAFNIEQMIDEARQGPSDFSQAAST